jgi:hypothetical protein
VLAKALKQIDAHYGLGEQDQDVGDRNSYQHSAICTDGGLGPAKAHECKVGKGIDRVNGIAWENLKSVAVGQGGLPGIIR